MTTSFETPTQAECFGHVCDCLERLQWSYAVMDGYPGIGVPTVTEHGHRRDVVIEVIPWDVPWTDQPDALVSVVTIAAAKPNLTAELMRALLEANWSRAFGRFSIDRDGDVMLRHELGESDFDEAQLQEAVTHVFSDACGFDQEFAEVSR